MCGLVALLSPSVPISEPLLVSLRDTLIHRGPDSAGIWIDSRRRVGLGHRRLSIVDLTRGGQQPASSPDSRYQLVFNGEIYNYVELRAQLRQEGFHFESRSDTEVLLYALIQWGSDALKRLNGMFAFAFWDSEKEQMLVARDRFGEKPLFVGRGRHNVLVVASEMKAILQHNLVSAQVSAEALERFGGGRWREDDRYTMFAAIERIPPAHAVIYDQYGSELRRWRFWTPDFENQLSIRPEEAVEEFTSHLKRSVAMRLRSDVSVGSSLSGGLDSSVLVAEVSTHRDKAQFTQNVFSACFRDDPTISEEPDVDRMVEWAGVHSFKVEPDPQALMDESMRLHWHQEEPFMSASIYLQWCVARLAQDNNTTVLIDGQGADELMAGYQSLFPLWQLDMLDLGQIDAARRDTEQFTHRLELAGSEFENVARRFDPAVAYSLEDLDKLRDELPQVWHNDYDVGTARAVPGNRMRRVLSETLLYNGLPMLLRYADRNSMAFGREVRLPFLDYELADFCISLPSHYLIREGWQKWILRMHADTRIPKEIAWRADKVGYAAPLDIWLRAELKVWAGERLFDPNTMQLPGYNRVEVDRLWHEHQAGTANNSWTLWQWVSVAEWMELARCGYWKSRISH